VAAAAAASARTWQLLQWVFETIPQQTSALGLQAAPKSPGPWRPTHCLDDAGDLSDVLPFMPMSISSGAR
jgi:hypothetical protein